MSSPMLSKSPTPPISIPSVQHHPISPKLAAFPPDAAPALFLTHPSARLSSSPASSPRIVDSPPLRTRSIKPEMSDFMDKGMAPGADFFEDSSGEENSDWEQDGVRDFSEVERLVRRQSKESDPDEQTRGRRRGRSRSSEAVTALPPFNPPPPPENDTAIDSEESPDSPTGSCRPKKARQMSIRPLTKEHVQIVQNLVYGAGTGGNETPVASLSSHESYNAEMSPKLRKAWPEMRIGEGRSVAILPPAPPFQERKRRNTCESIRADSIINAHAITLRALEALSPTESLSRTRGRSFSTSTGCRDLSKSTSFTEQRRIGVTQVLTSDSDRPGFLPAHFIKTPYPFTARKEFPKPRVRPRQHDILHDPGHDLKVSLNGPGIVPSGGEFDLRSLLERNDGSQRRSRSFATGQKDKISWNSSDGERHQSVVWLSLRRHKDRKSIDEGVASKLVRIEVPSSLTVSSEQCHRASRFKRMSCSGEKGAESKEELVFDFDDQFLAERLREGYCSIAGSWFTRTFSARKLKYIRLGRVNVWSGPAISLPRCGPQADTLDEVMTSSLLAARDGIDAPETRSPFTEHNLMHLYQNPKSGKARYTWVHWARRVAATNSSLETSTFASSIRITRHHHPRRVHANSIDTPPSQFSQAVQGAIVNEEEYKELSTPSILHPHPQPHSHSRPRTTSHSPSSLSARSRFTCLPDTIITVQFVHAFSPVKIFLSLICMLLLSVVAALLWIFAGQSLWSGMFEIRARAERVPGGMALGVLVLLVQGVAWCAWVLGSWWWW